MQAAYRTSSAQQKNELMVKAANLQNGEYMEYHKVTLEDGKWVRPLLEATNYKTCEFAFANIYMWA